MAQSPLLFFYYHSAVIPNVQTAPIHSKQRCYISCVTQDYDPPSEGQVRRPVNPAHHDPILSLLAKMDQGVITQTRPDPEVTIRLLHCSVHTGALFFPLCH